MHCLWRTVFLATEICSVVGTILFLGGCNTSQLKVSTPTEQSNGITPAVVQGSRNTQTQVEMVNVNIHLDSVLILHIRHLSGQFLPTKKGQPPAFDDKLSYLVAVDSAEIGVTPASMNHAMNTYVFDARDAPLKNLTLSIKGNQIKQTGTLNKGVGIPFEMTGTMSATADGRIRIRPTQVKAAHLPVEGVMKLLGLDVAKLMNTRNTKGVSVEGNDIILDPAQMFPPPKMRGRITAVRIEDDEIIQTFGTARTLQAGKPSVANYMAYRGGVLRFGKLTMNDTDMRLIDADPTDRSISFRTITRISWLPDTPKPQQPVDCWSTCRTMTRFRSRMRRAWRRCSPPIEICRFQDCVSSILNMERKKGANFMNIKHLEQKLREKERELQSDLARFESEAQLAGDREVRDPTDDATASQGTSEAFEEGTIVSQTLEQVQDALRRLADGTYGTCLVCGRPIEPARLEALPWAANCLEDQEKQDARNGIHEGSTL